MNPLFFPNYEEEQIMQFIQKYCRNDFALIRITPTMLNKSIIDASEMFRIILKDSCIIDYDTLTNKVFDKTYLFLKDKIKEIKTSFYTANTRKDPRFWIYALKNYISVDTLIYFTTHESKLIAIPLIDNDNLETLLVNIFGERDKDKAIIKELCDKLQDIKNRGWIESVSPNKLNPKDVGETLEAALGIKPNTLISADYKGEIELKAKRADSKTKDTLFSMIPNWDISEIKGSNEMILTYGYPSNKEKYKGYKDLYVTVSTTPNPQGLYMGIDYENEVIFQRYSNGKINKDVCVWEFEKVKEKLYTKHPKTMWLLAENKKINEKINFKYNKVTLTQRPIFSQFLSLIEQGILTYDWRGRVREDGTGYKDKGHCFRISPKYRNLLFGETKEIKL
ncbi:MvaI/BcnI family restriction endonuclease [Clostridium ganghwense]|uniref:MvaI/BcnI family restriction endonuclease n=1 Tax=Clostridium ganghwense TaxID=312089 RepID=A0ABT4CQA9_9CLOT|nr:MvaI/BcnI family restriction endonuclease [Clostridium ganghwense]MCY6371235.1 MvaI/BcnI family restriction endonuclease [Clostridium ganghwense]